VNFVKPKGVVAMVKDESPGGETLKNPGGGTRRNYPDERHLIIIYIHVDVAMMELVG
jgi:hypothetical protein